MAQKSGTEMIEIQNPERACRDVESFIKGKGEVFGKEGVILGLSGGIDSSLLAFLCARSVGPEKVTALYMPERDSDPRHGRDAERVAKQLGIRLEIKDLTPILQAQKIYDEFPMNYLKSLPSKTFKGAAMKSSKFLIEKTTGRDLFIESHLGSKDKFVAGVSACVHFKHRMRMVTLYYYGELQNLLVAGATNRTEYLTGIFVKFGVDGVADILPLLPFYKTQIRQLAKYVGVPREIQEKPADADLFPGFSDKEETFGDEEVLDSILFCLEKGLSEKDMTELGLELKKVRWVEHMVESSRHMRESPYVLRLDI